MGNPFAAAAATQRSAYSAGAFTGANRNRLLFDWAVGTYHPDREARFALRELRARARDLVRNNPYAAGAVAAFADSILGWEGILLKPRITDPMGNPARPVNWEIERAWNEWSFRENASLDQQDSWLELQRLIVRTWVTDGEIFIRHRKGADNPFAYAIQLLDADLLDEGFNRGPDERGVEIKMGVEMDANGRRRAYHFWKRHPTDGGTRERVRIPAGEIIHHYVRHRPGQTRGYTLFAPVLTTVKMIDGLTEAELVASRLAAAKMGFISNVSPEATRAYAQRLSAAAAKGEEQALRTMDVAPGLIEELLPGQSFEGFDPTHPNTAFDPFLKVMLRGVARGFGMSYLTLTGDVGEANYSSMRAGLLPERDQWRILQVVHAARVHRAVYRPWLGSALLAGAVRLPTSVPSDYLAHEWRGRGWKWVDPLKDLQAAQLGIRLGLDSRQRLAAEQGRDFETVVDELAEEEDYAESQGVSVAGDGNTAADADSDESGENSGGGRRNRRKGVNRIPLIQEASRNGQH